MTLLHQGNHPISRQLINWFSKAKRDLPWRKTKDPYKIWLSEIILQQTRVDQGLPYYERFILEFPTIQDLANSSQEKVLKCWEGLGYYSRARNMQFTAQHITKNRNGRFPETYEDILTLKGVGPYTAAAIASIAFNQPKPVVDGNVFRFVSRYFGIYEDILKAGTRKIFESTLSEVIDNQQPGEFNQAIMEFGATICRPNPDCALCMFTQECEAFRTKAQKKLPVKIKKLTRRTRYLNYLILEWDERVLLKKRDENIWRGLYQFHLIEQKGRDELINSTIKGLDAELLDASKVVKHVLTHQDLFISFFHLRIRSEEQFSALAEEHELQVFHKKEVLNLPRPKPIVDYLNKRALGTELRIWQE